MRVIPDVDTNAERSEKQKAESSKFGFLSDMLNKNLDYLKIGFPKAYQPLNYAIKKNISLVSKTENGFEFDFGKLVLSEGKLPPISPFLLSLYNSATVDHGLRLEYYNDYTQLKKHNTDLVFCYIYIKESKILLCQPLLYSRIHNLREPQVNYFTYSLYEYRQKTVQVAVFLSNNKISSSFVYFGEIFLNW